MWLCSGPALDPVGNVCAPVNSVGPVAQKHLVLSSSMCLCMRPYIVCHVCCMLDSTCPDVTTFLSVS